MNKHEIGDTVQNHQMPALYLMGVDIVLQS